jgi:hypothetical protein
MGGVGVGIGPAWMMSGMDDGGGSSRRTAWATAMAWVMATTRCGHRTCVDDGRRRRRRQRLLSDSMGNGDIMGNGVA